MSSSPDTHPQVTSPAGTFRGTTLRSLQGHRYSAFLGIPYALPPVGNLRFSKPKPYPKIDSIYDATKVSPICIQPVGVDLGSPAQEDCLYLNVYAPLMESESSAEAKDLKKVFVYIHGGAFFMGSSREYVPGDLVAIGDVIVVTFNYRLSWLGFLKGNTPDLPGNQGMWDQLMALNWVKDNIRSFGGDPDDITLGGNSMGGESISAFSIISHGKGLFTKGFIMSGTMFTSRSTFGSSDVLLDLLTDRVGCKDKDIDAIVGCLKDLPAEKFVLPLEGSLTNKFTTIDGDLFSAPIGELISDKEHLENVGFYARDYLVTLTNDEGAVMFHGPTDVKIDPDNMSAEFLSQKFNAPIPVCEKIPDWYKQPGHFSFKPGHDILGDPILSMPAFKFLETFASYDKEKKGSSYFLWFDHSPSYLPSPLKGAGHEIDLAYLFDMPPNKMLQDYYGMHTDKQFTAEDFKLKNLYIDILAQFMKTGNPSGPLTKKFNLQWPAFDLTSEHYLNFEATPTIKQFPLKNRRQFWTELFPHYLEEYRNVHSKEEL